MKSRYSTTPLSYSIRNRAFTMVEVLLALSITLIGLVPILHLLTKSIVMIDSAWCLSEATIIGNSKLAEVMSEHSPEINRESGSIESANTSTVFDWEVNAVGACNKEFDKMGLAGLCRIDITIHWDEGLRQKQLSFTTYLSPEELNVEAVSQGKSSEPENERENTATLN